MSETVTTTPEAPARKLNLRRLERLQRLLQYGAVVVLLVFIVLIVVASVQLRSITARVQSAREMERGLQTNINALTAQSENLRAQVTQKQAEVDRGASALFTIRSKSEQAKELVDEAVKEASEKSAVAPAQLTPLVYIQIVRPDQMSKARELASQLKAKGYNVPGIENVGEQAALRQSEVRFCDGDAAARDLADIKGLVSSAGVSLGERNLRGMCAKIRARQYELWLSADFPPGRAVAPDTKLDPTPGPRRDPGANRRPGEPERPRRP